MTSDALKKLFAEVKRGKLSPDEAVNRLRHMPFEDLGFANVDHHRALRVGMPEIIFGPGKTPQQLSEIFARLAERGNNVLATRVSPEQYRAVRRKFRKAQHHELARAITLIQDETIRGKGTIAVVSAGTSDIAVAEEAVVTAETMGNRVQHIYDVGVAGHSSPAGAARGADRSARDCGVRRHGRRTAQRGRRTGRRAGDRRTHQRRLRRVVSGHRRAAGHAELLRLQRHRGEY